MYTVYPRNLSNLDNTKISSDNYVNKRLVEAMLLTKVLSALLKSAHHPRLLLRQQTESSALNIFVVYTVISFFIVLKSFRQTQKRRKFFFENLT